MLAPDRTLATLVGHRCWWSACGSARCRWACSPRHYGRRFALQIGTVAGILSGLISCAAVLQGSFALFCLGAFCGGFYAAGAPVVSLRRRRHRERGIPAEGDLLGAGRRRRRPHSSARNLIIATKDLWPPYLFAATYLAPVGARAAGRAGADVPEVSQAPPPAHGRRATAGRCRRSRAQPRFIVAVTCGVAAYAMMNLMMTSAPLAMVDCDHSVTDATLGIQWHVLGMYRAELLHRQPDRALRRRADHARPGWR